MPITKGFSKIKENYKPSNKYKMKRGSLFNKLFKTQKPIQTSNEVKKNHLIKRKSFIKKTKLSFFNQYTIHFSSIFINKLIKRQRVDLLSQLRIFSKQYKDNKLDQKRELNIRNALNSNLIKEERKQSKRRENLLSSSSIAGEKDQCASFIEKKNDSNINEDSPPLQRRTLHTKGYRNLPRCDTKTNCLAKNLELDISMFEIKQTTLERMSTRSRPLDSSIY